MEQIFISYRSGDAENFKNELKQAIDREFGDGTAYEFSQENEPGEDFPTRLSLAISRAKVILAIIGPAWKAESARRQLEGSPDWVRTELEDGFRASVPIVPIVIDRNHAFNLLDNDLLIGKLNRLHCVQLDRIQGQGLQEFVTGLTRRYNIGRADQNKQGHLNALRNILSMGRLYDPRRLLLHGPSSSLGRLIEVTITLLVVSAANSISLDLMAPLPSNIKGITLTMVLWSYSSLLLLGLLLMIWMIFPKIIYRNAPLVDTAVAAFSTVSVFVILLTIPSLTLLIWAHMDLSVLQFLEQLDHVILDPEKVAEQMQRMGDVVTNAELKIGLFFLQGLIFVLLFAFWYFRLTAMLQTIWRASIAVRCYWMTGIIILLAYLYRYFIFA